MKYLFNISLLIACLSLTLFSCKKDEHRIYFEGGTAPVLTASLAPGSQIPLSYDERENPVITLDWTNPAYKFTTGVSSQDVTYSLEVDTASVNFASGRKKTIAVSKDLSYTFTVGELNTAFISQLKLDSTKNNMIEMRVIASIGGWGGTGPFFQGIFFFLKANNEAVPIGVFW
ncbi:MAG TPA: SusE domain-containing protein, partial [Chitinophagaceae bacterium]|nr:SusE domain-containing protein [Chitinophagaceae bacterium]